MMPSVSISTPASPRAATQPSAQDAAEMPHAVPTVSAFGKALLASAERGGGTEPEAGDDGHEPGGNDAVLVPGAAMVLDPRLVPVQLRDGATSLAPGAAVSDEPRGAGVAADAWSAGRTGDRGAASLATLGMTTTANPVSPTTAGDAQANALPAMTMPLAQQAADGALRRAHRQPLPADVFGAVARLPEPPTPLPPAASTTGLEPSLPPSAAAATVARMGAAEEHVDAQPQAGVMQAVSGTAGHGSLVSQANPVLASLKTGHAVAEPFGQQLMAALGDRINVQVKQGVQNTTIRLDPPMLGSLEIAIRHEAGALQVRLTASNPDVVQQLQAVSDGLRQDLSNRQYTQVAVLVSNGDRSSDRQDGQPRHEPAPRQEKPTRALAQAGEGQDDSGFSLS